MLARTGKRPKSHQGGSITLERLLGTRHEFQLGWLREAYEVNTIAPSLNFLEDAGEV